jgi:hypothetical protein
MHQIHLEVAGGADVPRQAAHRNVLQKGIGRPRRGARQPGLILAERRRRSRTVVRPTVTS